MAQYIILIIKLTFLWIKLSTSCPEQCTCTTSSVVCTKIMPEIIEEQYTRVTVTNVTNNVNKLTSNHMSGYNNVNYLKLINIGINGIEPTTFSSMTSLTRLTISDNVINDLNTDAFHGCENLTTLQLPSNHIKTISGSFSHLVNLKTLDLSKNDLKIWTSQLPASLLNLNLEKNEIEVIEDLTHNRLKNLQMCDNNITSLSSSWINTTSLSSLCVGGSKFEINESDFANITLPNLTSLHIKGGSNYHLATVSNKGNNEIQKLINMRLRSLTFTYCILQHLNLATFSMLKNLSLINTDVYMARTRRIGKLPFMAMLNISGTPMFAQALTKPAPRMVLPHLQILVLSQCNLENVPSSLVQTMPNLTHLDISNNPLYCDEEKLSWIYNNNITLLNHENTVCAQPPNCTGHVLVNALRAPKYWLDMQSSDVVLSSPSKLIVILSLSSFGISSF